jgi:hypothetical protein
MEDDRWAHIGGVGSWVLWSPGCGLVVVEGWRLVMGSKGAEESDRERGEALGQGGLTNL